MKKLKNLILASLAVLSLAGCGDKKPDAAASRVTLDINPSFEIIVNDEGAVVSVNSLNDDALLVTVDIDVSGKTVEEVVKLLTSEAAKLGFLDKSNEKGENTVSISASSESEDYAEYLADQVNKTLETTLDAFGITKDIRVEAAMSYEEIKNYVKTNCDLVIEEAEATYADILNALNEYREKYSEFYSTEYADLFDETDSYFEGYYDMLNAFAYIKGLVEAKPTVATPIVTNAITTAETALNTYKTAIDTFIAQYKSAFIDSESLYQTSLNTILEKKVAVAKLRNDENANQLLVSAAEIALQTAEIGLATAKTAADGIVDAAKIALKSADTVLKQTATGLISTFSTMASLFDYTEEGLQEFKEKAENVHDYYAELINSVDYKAEKQAFIDALKQKKIQIKLELNVTVNSQAIYG